MTEQEQIENLKKEKEILIEFILKHKPEMEDWIKMNFREKQNER